MSPHDPVSARSRLLRRATTGATALALTAAGATGLLTYKITQDQPAPEQRPDIQPEHPAILDDDESEDDFGSRPGVGAATQSQHQGVSGGSHGS